MARNPKDPSEIAKLCRFIAAFIPTRDQLFERFIRLIFRTAKKCKQSLAFLLQRGKSRSRNVDPRRVQRASLLYGDAVYPRFPPDAVESQNVHRCTSVSRDDAVKLFTGARVRCSRGNVRRKKGPYRKKRALVFVFRSVNVALTGHTCILLERSS